MDPLLIRKAGSAPDKMTPEAVRVLTARLIIKYLELHVHVHFIYSFAVPIGI